MFLRTGLCILLFVVCEGTWTPSQPRSILQIAQKPWKKSLIGQEYREYSTKYRRKRSDDTVPMCGRVYFRSLWLIVKLLRGSTWIRKDDGILFYEKEAGYAEALRDFFSVGPSCIQRFSYNNGMVGFVGDRRIEVCEGGLLFDTFVSISTHKGFVDEYIIIYKQ